MTEVPEALLLCFFFGVLSLADVARLSAIRFDDLGSTADSLSVSDAACLVFLTACAGASASDIPSARLTCAPATFLPASYFYGLGIPEGSTIHELQG